MRGLLALLVACAAPTASVEEAHPEVTTQQLPPAVAGELYTAWLSVRGGYAPHTWALKGELPAGLGFGPAGVLSGVPADEGAFALEVVVRDDRGYAATAELELVVGPSDQVLACGGQLIGSFTEAADLGWYEVDFDEPGGFRYVPLALPPPGINRVELLVDVGLTAYLGAPGLPVGADDLRDTTWTYASAFSPLTIDTRTSYDLDVYRAFDSPISVLLVGDSPTDWTAVLRCTDGPIFRDLSFDPTLLGDPVRIDFGVDERNEGVEIWTDDALPPWLEWDRSSGQLTGIAATARTWPFTVHARTADGRERSEQSGLGVYEERALPCGATETFALAEGYRDGDLTRVSDPRGYAVFRTALDAEVSSVSATLVGAPEGEVSFGPVDGPSFRSGGAEDGSFDGSDVTAVVGPDTWPRVRGYLDAGAITTRALSWEVPTGEVELTVVCDRTPRPDLAALPVLEPGAAQSWQLEAVGGPPPHVFSATGLPADVALTPDGVLSTTGAAAGSWEIDLVVDDDGGASSTTPLTLYAGDASCQGYAVLDCGGSLSGSHGGTYFADWGGTSGATTVCVPKEAAAQRRIVLEVAPEEGAEILVAAGRPGTHLDAGGFWDDATVNVLIVRDGVDGVALDAFTTPSLADYADQPLLLTVGSLWPGPWTATLECL